MTGVLEKRGHLDTKGRHASPLQGGVGRLQRTTAASKPWLRSFSSLEGAQHCPFPGLPLPRSLARPMLWSWVFWSGLISSDCLCGPCCSLQTPFLLQTAEFPGTSGLCHLLQAPLLRETFLRHDVPNHNPSCFSLRFFPILALPLWCFKDLLC